MVFLSERRQRATTWRKDNASSTAHLRKNRCGRRQIPKIAKISVLGCKISKARALTPHSPRVHAPRCRTNAVEGKEPLELERAALRRIRSGDPSAWGDVYDLHAARLYRSILMPRLHDHSAAEDALSETFRTAMERCDSFQDQGSGIYPWLARIAHNKAMDLHRASGVTGRKLADLTQTLTPVSESVPGAEDLLALRVTDEELRSALTEALAQLNPRYQQAINLRFLQDKSRKECALELEVKVGTFDVLLLRALRALRQQFRDILPPSSSQRRAL